MVSLFFCVSCLQSITNAVNNQHVVHDQYAVNYTYSKNCTIPIAKIKVRMRRRELL
jgi:hypothetical protein